VGFACIVTCWIATDWCDPACTAPVAARPAAAVKSDPYVAPSATRTPTTPPLAPGPHVERTPGRAPASPPRPGPRVMIADDIVVQVTDRGRPALLACVRRAQQRDPTIVPRRIDLQLDIDANGAVTAVHSELEDPRLAACFAGVSRGLHFPAPGSPAHAALLFIAP
jgi:hypothetical protein